VVLDETLVGATAVIDSSIVGGGASISRGVQLLNGTIVGFDEAIAADAVLDGARVPA
jgi:hypothetical protein